MTNRRFPVAGTDLTIPWEVAEQMAINKLADCGWKTKDAFALAAFTKQQTFTEEQVDIWYGKHWREVAK